MRFVPLIAIAVSLLSGPFAPMALCSMPAPCHGEHSCCLVASPDMQAVLPAHTASFDMGWMPLAMMSPASAYEFVDDRLLRVPPDPSRFSKLCVLRR
jgi:hypothetical protein